MNTPFQLWCKSVFTTWLTVALCKCAASVCTHCKCVWTHSLTHAHWADLDNSPWNITPIIYTVGCKSLCPPLFLNRRMQNVDPFYNLPPNNFLSHISEMKHGCVLEHDDPKTWGQICRKKNPGASQAVRHAVHYRILLQIIYITFTKANPNF